MAAKKSSSKTTGILIPALVTLALLLGAVYIAKNTSTPSGAVEGVGTGYDQYGYNYTAMMFQGPADGVDRNLDGTVWGDPTYAKDHLVMKWSKAWNDARYNGAAWTPNAWEDNEWNGKVPGGSGEVWHYKISWVGSQLQSSPYWKAGGYPIWGQFEVIFSQGTTANQHFWETHANPAGYGTY